MARGFIAAAALLALFGAASASAELPVGAAAPNFAVSAAMGGKVQRFDLHRALRRGPVVLYFFPKAFSQGCTLETRAFAEAIDQFHAAHATVIGMSADDLPTLQRFSTEECRSKFAVAPATPAIVRAYDVAMRREQLPVQFQAHFQPGSTGRTSYVIARDGRVSFVHSELDYREHVRLALAAVQSLARHR